MHPSRAFSGSHGRDGGAGSGAQGWRRLGARCAVRELLLARCAAPKRVPAMAFKTKLKNNCCGAQAAACGFHVPRPLPTVAGAAADTIPPPALPLALRLPCAGFPGALTGSWRLVFSAPSPIKAFQYIPVLEDAIIDAAQGGMPTGEALGGPLCSAHLIGGASRQRCGHAQYAHTPARARALHRHTAAPSAAAPHPTCRLPPRRHRGPGLCGGPPGQRLQRARLLPPGCVPHRSCLLGLGAWVPGWRRRRPEGCTARHGVHQQPSSPADAAPPACTPSPHACQTPPPPPLQWTLGSPPRRPPGLGAGTRGRVRGPGGRAGMGCELRAALLAVRTSCLKLIPCLCTHPRPTLHTPELKQNPLS